MSSKECNKIAKEVYRELNRMNRNLKYNNNKYYNKFLPMSFFENEIGEHEFYENKVDIEDIDINKL